MFGVLLGASMLGLVTPSVRGAQPCPPGEVRATGSTCQRADPHLGVDIGQLPARDEAERKAQRLVLQGNYEEAVKQLGFLIQRRPLDVRVVDYYSVLLQLHQAAPGRHAELERDVKVVSQALRPTSKWYAHNKEPKVRQRADELVRKGLSFMASRYHRAAQQAAQDRRTSQVSESSKRAAAYYKEFLDRFSDHEQSYALGFYYAEVLYEGVEDYELAAKQYQEVLGRDRKGEYVEDAALGVIDSIKQLMCEKGLGVDEGCRVERAQYIDPKLEASGRFPETALHPLESRFVNAADTYVEVMREALEAALSHNVYTEWSRKLAEYAAKVNPDEFPIARFNLAPDKTRHPVYSTSFIRHVRRGDTVVDFTKVRARWRRR